MKLTKGLVAITAVLGASIFGLTACEQKKSEQGVAAPVEVSSSSVDTACGIAPSGNLVAERIVTANSTRTEPGLYEGPVWANGALYFSDFIFTQGFSSRIQRLNSDGTLTVVVEDSGSNGLAVDSQGALVAATHKYKSLSRYNIATGERTSVAEKFNGNVFNSPNDLTIAKDGTIYFTDPDYQRDAAPGGQEKTGVYRVGTDGVVTLVDDTLIKPNGIVLSLDESVLYVNGGTEAGAVIRSYPIVNGIPQAGKNFVTGIGGPDGMTLDCKGNVYLTEHAEKRVRVFTPAGENIATINVDANITNAAFGGAQGKTLYLTGAGSLWKIELGLTGNPY